MNDMSVNKSGKCPFGGHTQSATGSSANLRWWPNQLNLKMLHQNSALGNPMSDGFSYAEAFKSLDLKALKQDLYDVMTDSQDWCCLLYTSDAADD